MAQTILRDYLQETEDTISSGHVDDALIRCQHILDQFPESLDAQRLLGEVYLAQGNLQEAQHTFDWVLTNDPENVIAYCDRALISERNSDYDTALDCYQQAYELSRGNSQIRNEFNKVSAKAGQQGFMFSRAGLARLYMRGDLLTQAIQEWEVVLAANPDRLDARTGLLETYWREHLYEQVEQLATQILQDVPTCLKALLLLAHVTSARNMQQARDLVRQAEALDPDLVMAQELFADMLAAYPANPFLQLLRKSPVALDLSTAMAPQSSASKLDTTFALPENTASPEPENLPVWTSDSIPDFVGPARSEQSDLVASAHGETPSADPWYSFDQQPSPSAQLEHTQSAPWQGVPDVQAEVPEEPAYEPVPWESRNELSSADLAGVDIWDNSNELSPVDPLASDWMSPAGEEIMPTPPAWLSMLTQGERAQLSGTMPVISPSDEKKSPTLPSIEETSITGSPAVPLPEEPGARPQPAAQKEAAAMELSPSDTDEESFFGPEWLKSLGAAEMDAGLPQAPGFAEAPAEPSKQSSALPSMSEAPEELSPLVPSPGEPRLQAQATYDPVFASSEKEQQNLLSTLEELEKNLFEQGFISLEPNSLAAIAQDHGNIPAYQQHPSQAMVSPQDNYPDPALSSALAELGNFAQQFLYEDPSAGPVFIPAPETVRTSGTLHEQPAPFVASGPALEPAVPTSVEASSALAPRPNPFLDSELETTMRRPAVRLQHLQARPSSLREQGMPNGKLRSAERIMASKGATGNLSYQERLVKGYQQQLAGDYDEAMHDYRIIIKSAPELLSEVVSNLRALLKLAPHYAAGYRVLGDVYMRQGEYLQAMEAYNKALTMAKRARN